MIQRIQTLYLLVGALLMGAFFFADVAWGSAAAEAYAWFTPVLLALTALAVLVGVGAVFFFRNRTVQRKAVVGAQMCTVGATLVLYGALFAADALAVTAGGAIVVGRLIALLLPVAAYVFFFLGRRAIDRDIALVRSMDRLR